MGGVGGTELRTQVCWVFPYVRVPCPTESLGTMFKSLGTHIRIMLPKLVDKFQDLSSIFGYVLFAESN